ncbi:hypothetical protein T484DRAFT_2674798 [Baffinella frigidus]|nr:hypothetical protein T484DRAFT_2674798 [Cryptophyta sp. CCMP2293]
MPPPPLAEEEEPPEEGAPPRPRIMPGYSNQELLTMWVTALTGWHPECIPVNGFKAWEEFRRRLTQGSVFPVVWGNHPQERLKYISTQSVEGVSDFKSTQSSAGSGLSPMPPPVEESPHWDPQSDASFSIRLAESDGEHPAVEVQLTRLSWLLPHGPDPFQVP